MGYTCTQVSSSTVPLLDIRPPFEGFNHKAYQARTRIQVHLRVWEVRHWQGYTSLSAATQSQPICVIQGK